MKALLMSFRSESLRAVKSPVSDMTKLTGGIGHKLLDERQIIRLRAAQLAEQEARKERLEWQRFAKKCSTAAINKSARLATNYGASQSTVDKSAKKASV